MPLGGTVSPFPGRTTGHQRWVRGATSEGTSTAFYVLSYPYGIPFNVHSTWELGNILSHVGKRIIYVSLKSTLYRIRPVYPRHLY